MPFGNAHAVCHAADWQFIEASGACDTQYTEMASFGIEAHT